MKTKILTLCVLTLMLSACNLNFKPVSSLSYNGFWDSEEKVKSAQVGVYSGFRGSAFNTLFLMGEMRTDIWGGQTIGEDPYYTALYRNNFEILSAPFGNWAGLYSRIHYINDFITNAPNVTFKNEKEKNHLMGQMHGLRAQVYFFLIKAYGDVPITLEPLVTVNLEKLKKERSPKADVMNIIKADIEKSLSYFGDDNSKWLNSNTYWSKAATLALKGDVYLWAGSVLGGGQEDFKAAKEALMEVKGYSLVKWDKLWGQANEANSEFIFAIDYQLDQSGNSFYFFTGNPRYFTDLVDEDGKELKSLVLNGASRGGPSAKTIALFSDKDDARRSTFIYTYKPGNVYAGSILNKFFGIVENDGLRKSNNNVPVYRYADVLLMIAEAKNRLGEDPSSEINQIRERAYGDKFAAHKFVNGTVEENTKTILNERYKEFIGEGKRWADLVRGGDILFEEVPTIKKSEAYKIYYPISNGMINSDNMLKQTDGWKK